MRRITSALFLDFDNLLSRLLEANRDAGRIMAADPGVLVAGLEGVDPSVERDFLIRRAYVNPAGSVPHPEAKAPRARQSLSDYRGRLTRAGFEVIDCPQLTKGRKNAADIRMVVDILGLMEGPVRYDEIVIASDDSDFTPLLIKLRALDRRTTIVGTGEVAKAYGAAADRRIGETELVALLTPEADGSTPAISILTATPVPPPDVERLAVAGIRELVARSEAPVPLAATGKGVREKLRDEVAFEFGKGWFGYRTLSLFVAARLPDLRTDATYVWDPARHAAPKVAA